MDKHFEEIITLVNRLLKAEKTFKGYAIEKQCKEEGIKLTRSNISKLRTGKTELMDAQFSTIKALYDFAKKHEKILLDEEGISESGYDELSSREKK